MLFPWKKSYDQPRQHVKKHRDYFANKGPSSQRYGFSSSHVWMWELDHKEGRAPKNWCFQTVVLEKTLESPLDCMEIKLVNPKGNQPWIFIWGTDAEAPIFWPHDGRADSLEKTNAGRDWSWEENGMTEDEMVGWHYQLYGHEFEQASGDGEGQGSLVCCSPWSCRVRHFWVTEQQQSHLKQNSVAIWMIFISQLETLVIFLHVCVGVKYIV